MYLFGVTMDGNSSSSPPHDILDEDQLGFALVADGANAPMLCKVVRGFQEALDAAHDPGAPMPTRLVLVSPAVATFDWLAAWAEDDEQVRRRLTIRRHRDGAVVIAVVTLAAFGHATHTSLTVESLTLPTQRGRIVRSGVHPKSFLAAIRAQHKRALQQPSANDVRPPKDPAKKDPANGDLG
ncbi:MAG TPA: hypothetical protein PK156_32445 [Polyangium sp.]|nr:hypothetical protein [Polyangium sp.]